MKKIAIVTRSIIMGGIGKALISMLNSIPKDKYDVTVFVMGTGGELENEIPKHVKVECLYGYEKTTIEKIWNYTKDGKFIRAFKTGWYTLLAKKAKSVFQQEWYHSKFIPKVKTEYDLAIAYHVPASFPVIYVMNNLRAKSKIAWIHSDVSQYVKGLRPYHKFYEKYDKIFCVSEYALKRFNELYPHLKEKASIFYNLMDKKQMEIMAGKNEGFNDRFDGIRILTVGRLTEEKGHALIPGILMKLIEEGYQIRWYCIGDGKGRLELEHSIKQFGLEDQLILFGTKCNPYPYIKQCDIYVQPSRHEGYCLSLAEARAFYKPIITTGFEAAREQIESGQTGLIVNFDENEMYQALKTLINNPKLCAKFEDNLKKYNVEANLI